MGDVRRLVAVLKLSALVALAACPVFFVGCGKPSTPTVKFEPPQPPRVASEGCLLLTKRITHTSDTGVMSWGEGTEVVVLENKNGKIRGRIDGIVVVVNEADTTDNLDKPRPVSEVPPVPDEVSSSPGTSGPPATNPASSSLTTPTMQRDRTDRIQELQTWVANAKKQVKILKDEHTSAIAEGKDYEAPENKARRERINRLKESISRWEREITYPE